MPPQRYPYIPQTKGEMMDYLAMVMLSSPTFKDDYFPYRNVETVFYSLNEGLKAIRKKVGEERYAELVSLSDRMRAHFEADPEDKTEDTIKGRELVHRMEDIITKR